MNGNLRSETDGREWSSRLWWTLAGAALLSWAFEIEKSANLYRWAGLAALLSGLWGLGTVLASWLPTDVIGRAGAQRRLLAWATALITVGLFAVWAVTMMHANPNYGTDELAFNQYAGELARQGLNPYTHTLAGAFPMFRVSAGGYTYTLAGSRVTRLSYPALSFLVYVPFLALGWSTQLGPGLDVLGWALTVLLMFAWLPRNVRPLALILGSLGVYVSLAIIGLTDFTFMPLLVVAAYRWDRFDHHHWRTYTRPLALGLAMASKQTCWPILPFVLLALTMERTAQPQPRQPGNPTSRQTDPQALYTHPAQRFAAALTRPAAYGAMALAAFLIPNLPYLIASPGAWVKGTFTPLVAQLVPAGQGAIGLTLFVHIGGGSLTAFSLLAGLVLILIMVAFVGTYPLLRTLAFALPAVAYFFAERSYAVYLVALVPPGLIAALSSGSQDAGRWPTGRRLTRSRGWLITIMVALGAVVVDAGYALAKPAPLSLRVTRALTARAQGGVQEISLTAVNHTARAVSPTFTLETASGVTSFWHVHSGPKTLAAHASARYTLLSPDAASQPAITTGVTVLAYLTDPASVSVSNRFAPPTWHIGFDPEAFDNLLAVGRSVVIHADLLNEWNQPIRVAGVRVSLKQTGVRPADAASVNGHAPGSRAVSPTNRAGVATFTVTASHGTGTAVDFTATPLSSRSSDHVAEPSGTLVLRFGGG
ncbi:MAG: hypothetical protein ACP5H2_00320 [Solirubrobacteraceae bacterium]